MSIKNDNSFAIKSNVNLDNAKAALNYLKINNLGFKNNKLNQTIVHLDALLRDTEGIKSTILNPPKRNREFNDLIERYIHISCYDPCSYVREVRDLLFAGTDTTELDVTAEAVYIFAKYISKDPELLDAYSSGDIYTILHGISRDRQKVMMNTWIQGYYIEDLPYNAYFPKTAEYLKQTAIKKDREYARNSGLFRNIETNNLIEICKKCGRKITNHLHDAIYTTPKHFENVANVYHEVYGGEIKFKRRDYKNMKYDVNDYLSKREWKQKDMLTDKQIDDIKQYGCRITIWQTYPGVYKYNGWNAPNDLSSETLQAIVAKRIATTNQYQSPV